MPSLPRLEITQTYAKLGMESKMARLLIKQTKSEIRIEQKPAEITIHSPKGELSIDSSKAWDALAKGGTLKFNLRYFQQSYMLGLQGTGKIAEKGDRMAAIHLHKNPIPEMAREAYFNNKQMKLTGPPAFDNVDVTYIAYKPEIDVKINKPQTESILRKPEITYQPGFLNVYLLQKNKIDITFVIDKKI